MKRFRARWVLAAAAVTLVLGFTSCGGGGSGVDANLSNFKIDLDKGSASSGEVTFNIKNDGPSVHEFVVLKTDLAPDQLPTTQENGDTIADEEAPGIEPIDEVEDIASGASADLKVDLQPGNYVLICNIATDGGHYVQGMHTAFTVSS
jgi:uncharacterized cupredoxin-like copper-binding protein